MGEPTTGLKHGEYQMSNNMLGLPSREEAEKMTIPEFAHMLGSAIHNVLLARMVNQRTSAPNVIHGLVCSLVPLLHEIAIQTANQSEIQAMSYEEAMKADPTKAVKTQNVLFAALLIARCAPEVGDRQNAMVETNPELIYSAMEDFEKLTGQRPDKYLNPHMVKQIREFMERQENPLQGLLASRKNSPETRNTPLN